MSHKHQEWPYWGHGNVSNCFIGYVSQLTRRVGYVPED